MWMSVTFRHVSSRIGPLGLAYVLSGCATGAELTRARAAREYDCPPERVYVKWLGSGDLGDTYRARACGFTATYICSEVSEGCYKESERK